MRFLFLLLLRSYIYVKIQVKNHHSCPLKERTGQSDPPHPLIRGLKRRFRGVLRRIGGGLPRLKLLSPSGEGGNFYREKPLSRSFFLVFTMIFCGVSTVFSCSFGGSGAGSFLIFCVSFFAWLCGFSGSSSL